MRDLGLSIKNLKGLILYTNFSFVKRNFLYIFCATITNVKKKKISEKKNDSNDSIK